MSTEPELKPEIGHILSIDVVGYSKLLVNEQVALMKRLNQIVRETPTFRAAEKSGRLFVLPTGDGMILVFYQSPEEPLRCAVETSEALHAAPRISVRMGAHSGPVNEIEDVTGHRNVAGSGLNMVKRVLDCGDAGHILLSKRLSDDLAQYTHLQPYLHELGECVVKHGVRLDLVNFFNKSVGNASIPEKLKDGACTPPKITKSSHRALWGGVASLILVSLAVVTPLLVRQYLPEKISDKSVAVLPFENLSDEHDSAYFAEGVQDEILTHLAKVADLKVISRTSTLKYRGTASLNLRQIAGELGVRHIVEGTARRSGDNVHVSAQLIDAGSDIHMWAEAYDRQSHEVFDIESDICEQIAQHLQARVTKDEKRAIESTPTTDLEANALYIAAKAEIDRVISDSNQLEDFNRAEQLLKEATKRDPEFFLAFCKLAYVHDQIYFNSLDHTPERLRLAQEALDRAEQLDSDAGEYHLAAAAHYYFGYLNYDRARQELIIARQKLPNDSYSILLSGYIDRRQGRWDESTKELEHAVELDPRNLLFLRQLALSYNMLRRYTDMAQLLDRAIALEPNDINFLIQRGMLDLDWRANTKPLHDTIDAILQHNASAAEVVADQWISLALCEHDFEAASKALAAMTEKGCQDEGFPYSRYWCEGLAARERNDLAMAQLSFGRAKADVDRIVKDQPDFAAGWSTLGMIDAALGNKEAAVIEGRRAVEMLPVTKDAITGSLLLQNLACIYAWTGDSDAALAQLKPLVSRPGYLSYGQLRLHPFWQPLRNDWRFAAIVSEVTPK